jgi:hypothetical protein
LRLKDSTKRFALMLATTTTMPHEGTGGNTTTHNESKKNIIMRVDEPDTITMDTIENEQEQVEDILEGLLIFPSRGVLQSAWNKMETLFGHEQTLMKQSGLFAQEAYDSQLETQSHILNIFHQEMNGSKPASDPCCRSH